MHMADALLSPTVGATMWAATAGMIACCSNKLKNNLDDRRVPLMGVLGAFIFAAQMINFTIPGTGSSGHIGGGMILAVLLGPSAALITMASVLTVQALFFADGGLLALGSNIFNLGALPCFVAYPLLYRKVVGTNPSRGRILGGSLLAAITGSQLGAFSVVLETTLSGISELPFGAFALLMQSIHLAIGAVEGIATAAVVTLIWEARPEVPGSVAACRPLIHVSLKKVLTGVAAATILIAGVFSWFASTHPDGLEWAVTRVAGAGQIAERKGGIYPLLAGLQESTAVLPEYGFREKRGEREKAVQVDAGASLSGFVGGLLTLVLVAVVGLLLKKRPERT